MTKKHFIAVAATIKGQRSGQPDSVVNEALDAVAWGLAGTFAGLNPNFDKRRFLDACGALED